MFIFKLISKLPFFLIYTISDLLFMVLFYLMRYRRDIVMENLSLSFPEKSQAELKKIQKAYYRHMADIIAEVLKGLSMTPEKVRKRVKFHNPEVLEKYYQKGQSVILMTGHQGNWEWLGYILPTFSSFQFDGIYLQIDNPFFNKLMMRIRSHMGVYLMETKEVFKKVAERKAITKGVITIADQGPRDISKGFTSTFLNQDTTFFIGSEIMAKKYDMAVLYIHVKRVKRGYFEVKVEEIDAPPFREEKHYITKEYIRYTEQYIREVPSQWLWSHRRWKYNRKAAEEAEPLETAAK